MCPFSKQRRCGTESMSYVDWLSAMKALIQGKLNLLHEQGIKFVENGAILNSEMAMARLYPSLIVLADDMAYQLGMDGFDIQYTVRNDGIQINVEKQPTAMWTAPFIHYVTEQSVLQYGHDLSVIRAMAMERLAAYSGNEPSDVEDGQHPD